MIPRLIHQTIQDSSSIPLELQNNISHLKSLNPTYAHHLYDDRDIELFIQKYYSQNIFKYYKQLNPIYGPAKADFFRYLLMFEMGGIYLDIKSTIDLPLEKTIVNDHYLLSHWNNSPGERYAGWGMHPAFGISNEFQQWHIVAPPKHPFLKSVISEVMWNIDNYSPTTHGVGKIGVLNVTGPIAYSRAIIPIQSFYIHQLVNIEDLGFKYSITGIPGDELNHEHLFANHYRRIHAEPIVLTS